MQYCLKNWNNTYYIRWLCLDSILVSTKWLLHTYTVFSHKCKDSLHPTFFYLATSKHNNFKVILSAGGVYYIFVILGITVLAFPRVWELKYSVICCSKRRCFVVLLARTEARKVATPRKILKVFFVSSLRIQYLETSGAWVWNRPNEVKYLGPYRKG
jgi:hypothetical protein